MTLLIRDEDVREAVTPEDVIEAVENVYRQHGLGKVQDTPRREVRMKGKGLPHLAPGTTSVGQGLCFLEEQNKVIISHGFHFREEESTANNSPSSRMAPYLIHVIDPDEGKTQAIIQSSYASWMRTAAGGAVGAKYLARRDSSVAGIIGTGLVGKGQLLFLPKVRDITKAFVHSGRRKDVEYAQEMGDRLGIDIVPSDTVEEVVKNSEILVTGTRATQPIVKGEWVKNGTHINSIGADDPHKVELDTATLKKASKVIVDSERAPTWIGQIVLAIKQGALNPEKIDSIGQIVAGLKPGREDDDEITIYSCEGTNMQTAGVAAKIYEKVKKAGLGIETSTLSTYFLV
jgi:ornithine cyclodeaminase/alanine dehydrogenase-like protein (mu-crystallin family)